jgi:hypothetical protein
LFFIDTRWCSNSLLQICAHHPCSSAIPCDFPGFGEDIAWRKDYLVTIRNRLYLLGMGVILLMGCAPLSALQPSTPTPAILADCFLSFHVAAWEDIDGNGVWDASEPPLAGVEFQLTGMYAEMFSEQPILSDADGRAAISTWSPGGCSSSDYKITAVPPALYEPTTPASVTFTDPGSEEWQFGFRAISEQPE